MFSFGLPIVDCMFYVKFKIISLIFKSP